MSTTLVLGNGNLLLNFDEHLFISDLYWPHVGQENHLQGHHIKMYIWIEGRLSCLTDPEWYIQQNYSNDTLIGKSSAINQVMQIELDFTDTVLSNKDIYLKVTTVKDLSGRNREVKFFFSHDFYIFEHNVGDTACFYPKMNAVVHYKGDRYFTVGSLQDFYQFNTGISHNVGGIGTLPNPSTGELAMVAITQGSVESTISMKFQLPANGEHIFDYYIICSHTFDEAEEMKSYLETESPNILIERTQEYWQSWLWGQVEPKPDNQFELTDEIATIYNINKEEYINKIWRLYKNSLLIMRTQIDNGGGIVAANNSATLNYNRDTYSYVWTADGAYTCLALDEVGYEYLSRNFFTFCKAISTNDGYLLHKYTPAGSFGSSWHPWVDETGRPQLPIQEDETALVIHALAKHYKKYEDIELMDELWDSYIEKAGDFLVNYRYERNLTINDVTDFKDYGMETTVDIDESFDATHLPKPSYDRWEEKRGILTYAASCVYAGLIGAAELGEALGHSHHVAKYRKAAIEVKNAVLNELFDKQSNRFVKMIYYDSTLKKCKKDLTIDSTLNGIWMFGMLDVCDPKVVSTIQAIEEHLWVKGEIGGIARYQNDDYYRSDRNAIGNPWFICTLWMAQYYIASGDRMKAFKYIKWATDHAAHTGILAEQGDPNFGIGVSVRPLTWSHAEYVKTIKQWTQKI